MARKTPMSVAFPVALSRTISSQITIDRQTGGTEVTATLQGPGERRR
jgi:hypothetical protein